MTAAHPPVVPERIPSVSAFEASVQALAHSQSDSLLERPKWFAPSFPGAAAISGPLERAEEYFTSGARSGADPRAAAEWFLDNYYLIRRAAHMVGKPRSDGLGRLPLIANGPATGRVRIDVFAHEVVRLTEMELDGGTLRRAIVAYQVVSPLRTAELWALSTLLRAAVLEHLIQALHELHVPVHRHASGPAGIWDNTTPRGDTPASAVPPVERVERAIRALRALDIIDWNALFEKTNVVEAILRTDPARVYGAMDFETRDKYRKVIEAAAWITGRTEQDVAHRAIALANAGAPDERRGHVGYYLIAEGLGTLKRDLGSTRGLRAAAALATSSAIWGPPPTLPRLDLTKGLSPQSRTLVVTSCRFEPTALSEALQRIEQHYLSNMDPELHIALLTDADTLDRRSSSSCAAPLANASRAIAELNAKHGVKGVGPFHLLHRPCPREPKARITKKERSPRKLDELNRFLRGDAQTTYSLHVGDPTSLLGARFVIAVDADIELPMGSVQELVGLMSHPLNRAVVDTTSRRARAGYTVIRPRIEASPSWARRTPFSRMVAGDIRSGSAQTHFLGLRAAVLDLEGDLGNCIYDVDTFMRQDRSRGFSGRAGRSDDIILFESGPQSYATYALRHSSPSPVVVALLLASWLWLPAQAPLSTFLLLAMYIAIRIRALTGSPRRTVNRLKQVCLAVGLLTYDASVVVGALARALASTSIIGRYTSKQNASWRSALRIPVGAPRAELWRKMIAAPRISVALGCFTFWLQPSASWIAAPLLGLWFFAPEIAYWSNRPAVSGANRISPSERKTLRLLARRTWRFFDLLVGPNDQWLPVDNYQEEPHLQTAHRTSPTNIGLMLASTLSAYDFGYLGASELSLRLHRAFDSITRMPHHRGHLFNWYDTKSLQALLPRYVSTVDSGNLAGCLLALKQGCKETARAPVIRAEAWDGLGDSLELLDEAVDALRLGEVASLRALVEEMRRASAQTRENLHDAPRALRLLSEVSSVRLDREILASLESGAPGHDPKLLHALRTAIDRLRQHLDRMRHELLTLLPWLLLSDEAAAHGIDLPTAVPIDRIAAVSKGLRRRLDTSMKNRHSRGEASAALDASGHKLVDAFRIAEVNGRSLVRDLASLAERADVEARGMDWGLLYDIERRLFHIGYNVTTDQLDPHYYDLLASEARLASYIAIANHDVPKSHWSALGRPMTRAGGEATLLSWGGTMFEYLMPTLLMKSEEGTLLAQSYRGAVQEQIAYAGRKQEPWGISESAYARVDADQTYQYRSFGVPGLGLKRGLEANRVVTPYASLLAVSIRPRAVLDNLEVLEATRMQGQFGMFEALDLTPGRKLTAAGVGRDATVVRSYMAHHQGMLFVSLGNFLNRRSMVDRFHSEASMRSGDVLLNEPVPLPSYTDVPAWDESKIAAPAEVIAAPNAPALWPSGDHGSPQAFVLSNGRLTSLVTAAGAGGLSWNGLAITRYEPDPSCDGADESLYLCDVENGKVWSATSGNGRTLFGMHRVDLHLRCEGISVHVDVAVSASDDVEVREVTLRNESKRARHLNLTSAARPVLLGAKQAPVHPAFSSMFVESERVADVDGILFWRRPQTEEEEPAVLVHRLVVGGPGTKLAGYETDRVAFFGRGRSTQAPLSLAVAGGAVEGRVGAVLDPIMSLTARVELKPQSSVTLAFVTTVARSRAAAIDLARKYGSLHAVHSTFRDAEQEAPARLALSKLDPSSLPAVQQLFSALLFVDPNLRASFVKRTQAAPRQHRLWGRGISGDDPIVLVRVSDREAPLLAEVIGAQRYLRSCGVRLDLVLVDELPTGYVSNGPDSLKGVLAQNDVADWIDRHGGIFLIVADQVDEAEIAHAEACARVLLDTRIGSLAAQLNRSFESPPKLPRFEPTLLEGATHASPPRPNLSFDNGTGGFTDDGREYLVAVGPEGALPAKVTPAPWCNVLANPDFGCILSESSLGSTWSLNSGENRLTPWRNDPVVDMPSEVLYLRDEETAAVWSTTPLPAGRESQTVVRHGAGYTVYSSESHGSTQELTIFVPTDAPLKVARLRITNNLTRPMRLTATYYAEWVLGSRREAQRPYIVSELDRDHACLLATTHWNEEFGERVAFLGSKDEIHGATADRLEFLGRRGDYARPEALERWGLSGRVDLGADPCAVLQVHLALAPGASVETHFVLGQCGSRDEARSLVTRFRDTKVVEAALQELHMFWDGVLGNVRVKTPEPSMDLMVNRWLLYQTISSRMFGRTAFYQSSGAFGYRDQLQDVMALLHTAPQISRAQILEAAKHQFEEGDVLHWWHPPSGRGVRTRCSDDMAWLPYVTGEYVAATGDTGILEESVPFLEGAPLRPDEHDRYAQFESCTSAPLFEHCRRALERALTAGAHGLPLMGDGDWNDGMSRVGAEGRGESVWLGWFLCATIDRFVMLATKRGDTAQVTEWGARGATLREKIESVAWDGAWYVRAFHDDGSLVGSSRSDECRIDSIAQSWAALCHDGSRPHSDRTRTAVRAADDQLVRESDRLVRLFWPPFDTTQHDPGYIRAYPPGIRENGGQYTHAAAWLGIAHAALGDGERAERIFRLLSPILRSSTAEDSARYRVEPYVLAGDVYSCPPWVGRGGWTWYTGSAAWMWRLGVEAILGLRKEDGQLHIAPCIPPKWKRFEAWVQLNDQTVHVVVENPDHVASGVLSMTLDGAVVDSNRVCPKPNTTGHHEVLVRLGRVTKGMVEATP